MADNLSIDPGTTSPVATDDVSGVHYQKMKLNRGSDGVAVDDVKTAAITTHSSAAVATTSTTVVTSNTARRSVLLCNSSDTDIWLSYGGTAVVGSGLYLKAAGGVAYIDDYNGAINGIHAGTGTKNVGIVVV